VLAECAGGGFRTAASAYPNVRKRAERFRAREEQSVAARWGATDHPVRHAFAGRFAIARWLDYWDYNHIGEANLKGMRQPDEQFPADFKESLVGDVATARIKQAATSLNQALAANDPAGAAALFAPDATLVDLTAHLRVTGPRHITKFLAAAQGTLPYTGPEVEVRHVAGSDAGGGYEWKANGVVPRGVNVLELDGQGLITSFESIWDGSRLDDDGLLRLAKAAIER
jgi:hypothetical protein